MEQYLIYLRKSRSDLEAEAHGEGETLSRHEHTLLELAKRQHLNVTDIYREVVSGDTIAARPMMQRVLSEVEQGVWSGVLVMEVERLARGDTIDQGIIAQTFKFSGTKIITPIKTYDPDNEFDEEYFEFGLFMSRREYKIINRRLQRGRLASAKEGKWPSGLAPFGYRRVKLKNEKGCSLEPIEEQAAIVRMIFDLYTVGLQDEDGSARPLSLGSIATRLNDNRHYTKSNLNVCYAAPRSARKPRDWYETQFTVSTAVRCEPDGTPKYGYPQKNVPFVVITDDGYTFKCHTTSQNNKQFSAVGDELILGRWLKGRLVAAGLVTPVNDTSADHDRQGMITKEMLDEYGCNSLLLTKTDCQIHEDGNTLDVWLLSFKEGPEDEQE